MRRQVPEGGARGEGQERQRTASNSAARARDEGLSLVAPGSRSSRSTSLSNSKEDAPKVQERRNARGEARAHRPNSRFDRRWDLHWTHFLDAVNRDDRVGFSPSLDASGPSFMAPRPLLDGRLSPRLAPT